MTLKQLWKSVAERVMAGEREEAVLVEDALQIVEADALGPELIRQAVTKRVRDLISAAVKPTGETSRVPAGQQSFDWLTIEPLTAIYSLRRNVRIAYAKMKRAANEAQILGIVDASGLDPADYDQFIDLMQAARVPAELIKTLAA